MLTLFLLLYISPSITFCCLFLFKVLVINIFRDFNLSIHTEFEKLSIIYPNPTLDPEVVIPKGLKLKTTLKNSARVAVSTSAFVHSKRRIFLTHILQRTYNLVKTLPGIIGPKLPLIIALCSLAREELHFYFRHLGKISVRKDCKKYYKYNIFQGQDGQAGGGMDISPLLAVLVRMTNITREYRAGTFPPPLPPPYICTVYIYIWHP